jgi:uncharacterized membrane protein YccC
MNALADAAVHTGLSARRAMTALHQDLADLDLRSGRARQCAVTTLAVALATIVACALRVDSAWWAAISAFVSTQATAPASLQRGALRIGGTAAGAMLSLLASPFLVDDPVALSLALLAVSTAGVLGQQVSRYGYAFLLGAVTVDMVLLAAVTDPLSAPEIACSRAAEVTIGTLAAILTSAVLAPDGDSAPSSPAPGWADLLGAQWPAVEHALRAGVGVMLVPLVWTWLELPSLSQSAVTVAAVMAVPALSNNALADQQKIIERALHRFLGCLLGGTAGLVCLTLSVQSLLPWLLMLSACIWIAAHVQGSQLGISYIGIQGAVVFISTLVQGTGPPVSVLPGIDRLVGIIGGMVILLMVSLLTAPSSMRQSLLSSGLGPPP